MYKLRLYVTGRTPRSEKICKDLKEMLDRTCGGGYELEILDVFDHPEAAYEDTILATPTLMKVLPAPVRKIIGDLTNQERVLAGLEIEGI